MKILILYYELAGYNIVCFEQLYKFEEVHVVAYPVNPEAPFKFQVSDKIKIHNRMEMQLEDLRELFRQVNPELVFCAGWKDQEYLAIVKEAKATTILGFDNEWEGSIKQVAATLIKKRTFQKLFNYTFVPGVNQKKFAAKLGFSDKQILLGAYSCDYSYFESLGNEAVVKKQEKFPKRFLYIGRYIKRKGIFELWNAFIQMQNEKPNEWELWCIGTGDEYVNRIEHPQIKHFGFVQPDELKYYIENTSVFVLPSHFEPWGVVVHELASAGFPLLLSDKIGAGTKFLKHGKNGFEFPSKNQEELKNTLVNMVNLPEQEIFNMGQRSKELAGEITPEKWAATLMQLING